ncbi:MAG: GC-type dockerin domain-anchored protein [Phycisphaerales bacterium JB058]
MRKHALTALALVAASGASAQTFSLDDNPSAPLTSTFYGIGFSAEDPFGLFLPAVVAGRIGPSPSLITVSGVGYVDADLLTVDPSIPAEPILDMASPGGKYLDAVSQDHDIYHPEVSREMNIRFSVDRATRGLPGTPLASEFANDQHPGDIYISERLFRNPGFFVGTLGAGPFAGALPTAAPAAGSHRLEIDESALRLTPGLGPGTFIGPGLPAPMIAPGRHDNVDAFNILPDPMMDIDGDGKNDRDSYFSIPPTEALASGFSAADLFAIPKGTGSGVTPPWAPAQMMGLDMLGMPPNPELQEQRDDIDGLVVWDLGELNPDQAFAEPMHDYAIFSLSERSASLDALRSMGFPVDGSTIFYTDFSGAFAIYLYGSQVGIEDWAFGDQQFSNLDALEICAEITQPCDPCLLADVNMDGAVTAADFSAWVTAFNNGDPKADQNCDGVVSPADFSAWVANYNACTP